jgi:SAM-dependent methyltransferase
MISAIVKKIKRMVRPAKSNVLNLSNKKVYCVCCDHSFDSFLPFGLIKRNNALCPNCGSLERHRLHWSYMKTETNLFSGNGKKLKLLHVAPEVIFYNKFMSNNQIEYFPCAKLDEGYGDTYPSKTLNVDITNTDFADNEFDVIYCSHVLEHVIHDKKAIQELFRVLKPTGWAMLQVPLDSNRLHTYEDFSIIDSYEREKAFGQKDHVRIYGRDYKNRLEDAGFKVKVDDYIKTFTEEEIRRNSFMQGEEIYFCTKS